MYEIGFLDRLSSLIDVIGVVGLIYLIFGLVVLATIAVWKGTSYLIFLLFITYSMSAMGYGGVTFLATMSRWFLLFCLLACVIKNFHKPKFSIYLFLIYAISGLIFSVRSPLFSYSLQKGLLLLLVVVCVYLSVYAYVTSIDKVYNLFKMGIVSASFWTLICIVFFKRFLQSNDLRFTTGEDIGAVSSAFAGAYFSPMIIWGIYQNKSKFWRIYSLILIIPFSMMLYASGVRSAIFGLLIIASLPILTLKINPIKLFVQIIVIFILLFILHHILLHFMPDKSIYLTERIFRLSTTGRDVLWRDALNWCMREPFLGHGISASDIAVVYLGLLFHNAYLAVWYNAGILSLFAVVLFLIIYTLRSFRTHRIAAYKEISAISLICLGYMLAFMAIGFFEGTFAGASNLGVFMLIVVAGIIDGVHDLNIREISNKHYLEYALTEDRVYE